MIAHSLYRFLSLRREAPEIHVVAPAWSGPVLERMPEVARAIELSVEHGEWGFRKRRRLGRMLRSEDYSQAIVLPRSWKSALVPFFARVPLRTGFRGEWRFGLLNDVRRFDPRLLDQTVKRFVALGADPGEQCPAQMPAPTLRTDAENLATLRARFELDDGEAVALMPGAEYGPAKQWPLESYADLASRLAGAGVHVWVLGSAKEREQAQALTRRADDRHVHNLCGRTTLADVIDLLGGAKVAVSNDSGLMHVAAAVRTHVVALYGSSSPKFTPPLTDARDIFYLDLQCSPCFQRDCPLGYRRCLKDISVDSVCSAVITALGRHAPDGQ